MWTIQELTLNAGKVLTHTHLLNKVWGLEYREETQYLHVFIRRLRNKLEPDRASPTYIISVPGVGKMSAKDEELEREPHRTRTCNLLIKSQLLCQLS